MRDYEYAKTVLRFLSPYSDRMEPWQVHPADDTIGSGESVGTARDETANTTSETANTTSHPTTAPNREARTCEPVETPPPPLSENKAPVDSETTTRKRAWKRRSKGSERDAKMRRRAP